jgi:hypothetical protein
MNKPVADTTSVITSESTIWELWEERADSWALYGLNKDEIRSAFVKVESHDPFKIGKGSWVYELSEVAQSYEMQALSLENAGCVEEAVAAYRGALLLYDIARFPALTTQPRREAYKRMLSIYEHIHTLTRSPIQVVNIPYKDGRIRGYFRQPEDITNAPLVIYTGGLDTWKTSFDSVLDEFVAAGFATFTFDMPGTGESEESLDADGFKTYSHVVDYFKNYGELVDGEK